ncbi:hypothetical protein ACQCN2_01820 [Brevibacillus ginsengisoli]|uniref:hypothetical protein n=1 Tax=Brevibacillus ginsengisoli TaxID=363854 RepID=UPI003CF90EE3
MRQFFRLQTLYWAIYALALFLIYHLIIKIAFLEGSWIALVIFVPFMLLASLLIHRDERKQVIVFTLGFLLLDRSLGRVDTTSTIALMFGGVIAILVIALLAKLYGRLAWNAILALILVAVGVNAGINQDNLAALNHFYLKWESDRLYTGNWVDYFPTTLYDVDHDGKMEVITFGNVDEKQNQEEKRPSTDQEKKEQAEKMVRLDPEPVEMYVFGWKNGQMERIPVSSIKPEDMAKIKEQMPIDYPGFPYYLIKDKQLVPTVQRQQFAESMLETGTGPYRAFLLDMQNIDHQLSVNQGAMDRRQQFSKPSKFSNIVIQNGVLSGSYENHPFHTATDATKILDTMKLPDGREGLIVLGEHLAVLTVDAAGNVQEAYKLDRKEINGLATSDVIVSDIDHDNTDELLIANTPSYILKPTAKGDWQILWVSKNTEKDLDKSFRFSNVSAVGANQQPEIIAKAKSWVSEQGTRYLTGYQYTPAGLEQTWRIYLPLINVQVGDIDGDGQNEIVAEIYNTHRLLIFERHDVPVLMLTILLFIGLVGYGFVRRFRHA